MNNHDDWEDADEEDSYTTANAADAEESARFEANLRLPLPEDVRRMMEEATDDSVISEAEYRRRHGPEVES